MIGASAGTGVDSGLPDFRGREGFWNAYPVFREQGLDCEDLANPHWFSRDPAQAWGFYGHRLNLYRSTKPHSGFEILARIAKARPGGAFVYTSNVDGHFQRAGFPDDSIVECHGSIHHFQCAYGCSDRIWSAEKVSVIVDEATCRAVGALPACPDCGRSARPNILMFGDTGWHEQRTAKQEDRFRDWLDSADEGNGIAKIEFGAGTSIPSVRLMMEQAPGTLIRVNPRECGAPAGSIALPCGVREAIDRIAAEIGTAYSE